MAIGGCFCDGGGCGSCVISVGFIVEGFNRQQFVRSGVILNLVCWGIVSKIMVSVAHHFHDLFVGT